MAANILDEYPPFCPKIFDVIVPKLWIGRVGSHIYISNWMNETLCILKHVVLCGFMSLLRYSHFFPLLLFGSAFTHSIQFYSHSSALFSHYTIYNNSDTIVFYLFEWNWCWILFCVVSGTNHRIPIASYQTILISISFFHLNKQTCLV